MSFESPLEGRLREGAGFSKCLRFRQAQLLRKSSRKNRFSSEMFTEILHVQTICARRAKFFKAGRNRVSEWHVAICHEDRTKKSCSMAGPSEQLFFKSSDQVDGGHYSSGTYGNSPMNRARNTALRTAR